MLTYDIKWIAPIRVGPHYEAAAVVEGPMQALAVLNGNWPTTGAKHHQAALRECNLACRQLGRSEKSREAFMAAALEAGVLLFAQREEEMEEKARKHLLTEVRMSGSSGSVANF